MTRLLSPSMVVALLATALSVSILSCAPEFVEETFAPTESHRSYAAAIRALELAETEMGRRWLAEGDTAVGGALTVETPFREVLQFLPEEPRAVGFRFAVTRGHQVTIDVETELDAFFLDVFRASDSDETPTLVASRPENRTEEDPGIIVFEPRRAGEYILRIQPELLRGGRMTVEVIADAGLAFPVQDADPGDIRSFFGDRRDGGARIHEGVDIFAPRGTPLLAASESYVMRVGTRDRGGNVVVLHDRERDLYLYYAHLEEHRAVQGTTVQAGDIVGTTGNTGNAITTPPHLHIGIYGGSWRRALDPWDFFVGPGTEPYPVALPRQLLGTWQTIARDTVLDRVVRAPEPAVVRYVNRNPFLQGAGDSLGTPTSAAEQDTVNGGSPSLPTPVALAAGTAVQVTGGVGDYARVRTDTGAVGFVSLDFLGVSLSPRLLPEGAQLRDPAGGDLVGVADKEQSVESIGRVSGGTLVKLSNGRVVVVAETEI